MRILGLTVITLSLLAGLGEFLNLSLPTLRWPFEVSRDIPLLRCGERETGFLWFGWLSIGLLCLFGIYLYAIRARHPFSPITQRKLQRFKSTPRGYISFLILLFLGVIASFDQLLVGNEALYVSYQGKHYAPALMQKKLLGATFGLEGDDALTVPNYRMLQKKFQDSKEGTVLMPLIPFAPTNDTIDATTTPLHEENGLLYEADQETLFNGFAYQVYDLNEPSRIFMQYRYRKGKREGLAEGKNPQGSRVYSTLYKNGIRSTQNDRWIGEGSLEAFLSQKASALVNVHYMPSPPSWSHGNLLGTTSQGYDVLAYLFGGLQVNFKAIFFYIPIIYLIGVTVGLLMGFLGGGFDLFVQRIIEILLNIPFLFIVIIISSIVPQEYKGIGPILLILIAFGWMGMTNVMRAAAYKEKARDYIAASRLIGASTGRILFKHLLPNTVSILVTLIPFSISSLIFSLTALDYLGFGLPSEYATWGKLLQDGLANLSAPWLVLSSFFALVGILILITFVGEAIREAFDPKKFTYYR